jgi:hypothetical protein
LIILGLLFNLFGLALLFTIILIFNWRKVFPNT